jgi:hypothetical protein
MRVIPVVDERAASATPTGAIATGVGGTAHRPTSPTSPWRTVVMWIAGVLAVGGFVVRRRVKLV